MKQEVVNIYMMPGMAANPSIFENIKLPEPPFKIHWLEWFIPEKNETLAHYAMRMCEKIDQPNPVLLGVSFGGVLVQEMVKYIQVKKLIVVSSIKSKYEMPKHLQILKVTKAYKILPTQLVGSMSLLSKFALGETIKKRIELYKKYLSVDDKRYLDWAIKEMVCWDQSEPNPKAIYIHGSKDSVFPDSCVGACIVIKGGTHVMIINKYKWFNENLPKLILN